MYRHVYISSISYIKSQMICDASPTIQTPPLRSADCWMTSLLMSIDVHWTQAFGVCALIDSRTWFLLGHQAVVRPWPGTWSSASIWAVFSSVTRRSSAPWWSTPWWKSSRSTETARSKSVSQKLSLFRTGCYLWRKQWVCFLRIKLRYWWIFRYGGFHTWRYPNMESLNGKILLKWMIWGYPYFRKPPYFSKNKGTQRNIQSVSSNQMNRPSQGRSNVSALVSGL